MEFDEATIAKAARYYDENGLLKQYPSKQQLKELALYRIAEKVEAGKDYTEKEITALIKECISFPDAPMIRRELIDMKFMAREKDGSRYWKLEK